MKVLNSIFFTILLGCSSCNTNEHNDSPKSFDLNNRDTINLTDVNGLRQGIWVMPMSKDTMVYLNDTGHSAMTITTGELLRILKKEGNKNIITLPDTFTVKSK